MSVNFKTSLKDTFGQNLKYYRYQKGYSQEKLAEMVDLNSKYVSDIETGKYSVSFENIERIAKVLSIEAYLLFKFDDTHNKLPLRVDMHRVTKYHINKN